ncbi:MAG: bifunctional 5,10-methylene-tetrahydrofolate dehydrogenase/5,10-methylene-tetrahydrofolate cyclohydrolase [Saprospiraceae bacterium]|nr:bifunctional 5,10-methylene-tetrahydrofolate dehydrogenase/5,10-methylene-tetrahydrofolate cyclohydrolase [Saprospiraceae bacterium]MCB9329075.1 bifunctional 5,10-methylene-tetrahydrofolate dehydrogenase/5,10-methylene-tetrahydrofolate cyclohydrolase [Lewinellaceae bacterium]HPK09843.1 tetrahydrofolate dehydrogenase/cyclohydrolase catalytic domain-containing protein [Saprospiraceae bacterium]
MQIIDGKALANQIKEELKLEVEHWVENGGKRPHLAAVLVGDDPASQAYVRNKVKSCEQVGFQSTLLKYEADMAEDDLLDIVKGLNENPEIDGYIVQLPLPKHIDENKILLAIDYRKDVDGFHPVNFGRMAQGLDSYLPATPMGILTMLDRYNIETSGKDVVVLGRSNIVGTPISILLSRKAKVGNATVTLTHSRTSDLEGHLKRADIIVAAIGIPLFVKKEMVKQGAVIIDVGINRVTSPDTKSGYKLVGDVDYDHVAPNCSHITPVPGGVGPMTVVSLLQNTMKAAKETIYNKP